CAETDSPPGRGQSRRASRTDAQVDWGRRADRTSLVFADVSRRLLAPANPLLNSKFGAAHALSGNTADFYFLARLARLAPCRLFQPLVLLGSHVVAEPRRRHSTVAGHNVPGRRQASVT